MRQKRKIYDVAFKRQAVELCEERKNFSELARELGFTQFEGANIFAFIIKSYKNRNY